MNERSKILYDKLVEKGLYTKPYEEFTTQFSTPEKKAKLHSVLQEKGLYTKPYEEFDLQFFPEEKKKDSPNYSPLQGAASGKNILQDIVPSLGESTTPKLPSQLAQKPKATRDETLATDFTVSSVLKAQQKLPEYLQGEQERIVAESTQSIKDELSKLKENYQKKIDANPEKEKELQDEFDKEQNKIIDLRSAAIPMAVESLYKKGKEYKTIDPNDVKELTKAAREIASKPTDFIQKENDLKGLKNSFLSTLGEIPPADKAEIEKELNDIIVQNSILTEQGTPSVFGWKKEVLDKKQKADQRLAELGTAEQTQEEKAEANLLFRASKYYDRILSLPDNEGSFLSGLKSEGRNMLTAGMSDLFDASNIVAISKKQMNGEELTKGEQTLYDAYGVFQTAQNAEQFGKGYERGKGIGGSVAFMGSFALTSGLAGLGEKTALKVLGSQVKNKVVQNIAKGVGSAAVRTPLLVGGMTETAERLAGRPKLDDNGEWKVDPTTVEPVMKAIGKGLYSNFANALGETAGGWLGGTKVSNIVSKTLGLNKIPKNVAKIFNTIGMQPLGELPEEYLTTLMETPVMGDQSLKEAFSGEAMWETAVQVGIMSGFFSSVALPSVASQNAKRSQNANLIKIFGKDRIQTLRTAVENNDKEAFTSALKETLESGAMEEAGMDLETVKRQITRYAFELGQSKGFKVSQEVAKDEAEQTTPATTEETNAAPAEVKETFTIPQVKADPIVFEGKEQLFDFLDKGGESRMPGVDDVGYLDNNVYKAMDEWKKARKVQLGSAMVNKVNFTGQMKDEDGTPILDQYNVEVDGREATFSVPVQGDKTDAEYFESVAKKKAEILKPYQNEKTQNILTSREDLLSSQQNLTDESNRQNQGTVTSGGLQQVVDGGTDAQVMDGKQSRYDIGASGSVLGDTSVKDYSLSDQEAVDLQTSIPNSKTDVSFSETNDANLFHSSISESKKGNKFSASVWVYSPEEYASARKFLTPDGKAGLAITPEGDIISVFSHKEGKGRVPQLMINAIKEGGVTLDNYEGLVEYYAQFGFIPVAKVKFDESQAPPDWNKDVYKDYKNGMPDVVAMVYHGGDPNTLSQRVRKFGDPKLMLDSTPYVDTWEEAKKIQREYAQKIQSGQKSGQNGRTTETQPSQSKESVVSPVESEKGIGVDKSRQSVAKDVAINIGDEMGGEKLPSVDNVYSILEDEESRQGGNWTNNEFGDARFESEQQARAYAQEVHDFLVSLGEAKEIPVYRAVSADEVDLDPYGIGESWSFSLDAAKQFARMNLSGRKIKIISGLVPSENVNWEQAVRLYHNFSDITDGDSEFELPIPANRKILDVRVDDVKNAKERESGNEGINKELSDGIKPSKEHGQNVQADVQVKIDEVKAKIADDFDALMTSIGGKTDLTGVERENALKILARLIGNLAELTSLKGQQLYDELKKQLKEKGITLPADVIDEAVQRHSILNEKSFNETRGDALRRANKVGLNESKIPDDKVDNTLIVDFASKNSINLSFNDKVNANSDIAHAGGNNITVPNNPPLTMLIHELGHIIDDKIKGIGQFSKDIYNSLTTQGAHDGGEAFAENVKLFFLSPKTLEELSPRVYNELLEIIPADIKKGVWNLLSKMNVNTDGVLDYKWNPQSVLRPLTKTDTEVSQEEDNAPQDSKTREKTTKQPTDGKRDMEVARKAVEESSLLTDDTKEGIKERGIEYVIQSDSVLENEIEELVSIYGTDAAGLDELQALVFNENSKLAGDKRNWLAALLIKERAKEIASAPSFAEKVAAKRKLTDLIIYTSERGVFAGREVRSFKKIGEALELYPEAIKASILAKIDEKQKDFFDKNKLDKIVRAEVEAYFKEKGVGQAKEITPDLQVSKQRIAKEQAYRKTQWEAFKKPGNLSSSVMGLSSEQIENIGNIIASYVREGYIRTEAIVKRFKKEWNENTGQKLTDEEILQLLPNKKIDGKTLEQWDTYAKSLKPEPNETPAKKKEREGRVNSAIKAVEKSIKEIEKEITALQTEGKYEKAKKERKKIESKKLDNLRKKRDALKVERDNIRKQLKPQKPPKASPLEKKLTDTQEQIDRLDQEIYELKVTGELAPKEVKAQPDVDPELQALRDKRDALKEEKAALQKKIKVPKAKPIPSEAELVERLLKKAGKIASRQQLQNFVKKYLMEISEKGILNDAEFRNILAEVLGREYVSEQSESKIDTAARAIANSNEKLALLNKAFNDWIKEYNDNPKSDKLPELRAALDNAIKEADKAIIDAKKSYTYVTDMLKGEPSLMTKLGSLIQGGLLIPSSQVANLLGNMSIMPQTSLSYLIAGGFDALTSKVGATSEKILAKIDVNEHPWLHRKLNAFLPRTGRTILPSEYFSGYWRGFGQKGLEGVRQTFSKEGALESELMKGDAQRGLHPIDAINRIYNSLSGREKRTFAQVVGDVLEANPLAGMIANVQFRGLNLFDMPFRGGGESGILYEAFALRWNKKVEEAEAIKDPVKRKERLDYLAGIKDIEREQFYRSPDSETMEIAKRQGRRGTFSQSTALSNAINSFERFAKEKKGSSTERVVNDMLRVLKFLNMPYVVVPINIIGRAIEMSVPIVPLGKMVSHTKLMAAAQESGDTAKAQEYRKLAMEDFGNFVVAAVTASLATSLALAGVISWGSDDDKIKTAQQDIGKEGLRFNADAFWRWVAGEDPTWRDGDDTYSIKRMGILSVQFGAMAQAVGEMTPEEIEALKDDKWIQKQGEIAKTALQYAPGIALEQGIMTGLNTMIKGVMGSEAEKDQWIINMSLALSTSVYSNTLANISQSIDGYYREVRDVTKEENQVATRLRNSFKDRMFMSGELPVKVSIWGEDIRRIPEGENKFLYGILGIAKHKKYQKYSFGSKLYETFEEYSRTDPDGAKDLFPSRVDAKSKVGFDDALMSPEQFEEYQRRVGRMRAQWAETYFNSEQWEKHTVEEQYDELRKIYSKARKVAEAQLFSWDDFKNKKDGGDNKKQWEILNEYDALPMPSLVKKIDEYRLEPNDVETLNLDAMEKYAQKMTDWLSRFSKEEIEAMKNINEKTGKSKFMDKANDTWLWALSGAKSTMRRELKNDSAGK